ncbi:MAG: class I SAM-dependent methyltransferase [Fimbriimonas sp.]
MADFTSSVSNIPANYETGMGPIAFAPYAEDVARRVAQTNPQRVLEIAAGTGRVTRELCKTLGPQASLEVTDLNADMLQVAKDIVKDPRINWSIANAVELPFEDDTFDAVLSQFGVMFYPDKVQGHREAKRVLKPGGVYHFTAWGKLDDNPWSNVIHKTMAEMFPENQPMFLMVPFSYNDPDLIRSDLSAAGFTNINIEGVQKDVRAPSARELAVGVVEGSPLAASIAERGIQDLTPYVDAVEERYVRQFGDKPMLTTMKAFVVKAQ